MQGAQSFAAIILTLSEAELAVVRRDEADDIIVWLARWRTDVVVDKAYQRLIGKIN